MKKTMILVLVCAVALCCSCTIKNAGVKNNMQAKYSVNAVTVQDNIQASSKPSSANEEDQQDERGWLYLGIDIITWVLIFI